MKVELTNDELTSIIDGVTIKLRKEFLIDGVKGAIYNESEKIAIRLFELHKPDILAKCGAIDLLLPVVRDILNKNSFLEQIIENHVDKYFNTESFKKLSIKMLEDKIEYLKSQLSNDNEQ